MRVARQSLLQRPFDILICVFYGISIPIALLIDSQQGSHLNQNRHS
jgi:hypothetical protein